MKLTISKNANINYLARIVQVDTFHPHPNADKLKLCTVEGYIISTGIDSVEGIYVYFPVECVINPKFLKYHNLYRKKELNQNPEQSGFLKNQEELNVLNSGGGIASEGFIMPINSLISYINDNVPEEGIVLRREVNGIDVYKLKSINFLEKESKMLDRGEIDIESNQ